MNPASHFFGWAVLGLGWIFAFLGGLWIIVLAWQRSVVWGLGCILVPVIQIIYVVLHWKESKEAFFMLLGGLALIVIARVFGWPN
jgi:hypothetical protein